MSRNEVEAMLSMGRKSLVDYSILMQKEYRPNWHHEVLAKKLELVSEGKCRRLMVFMPPRHGKSELASIKFPAWYLGKHPDKEVICCSATAEGAEKFARKTRDLVQDELHGAMFPDCKLQRGSKSVADWRVSKRGGMRGTGIGGLITGMGANILIIEDPIKDRNDAESDLIRRKTWDWYTSTAFTRLEKGGAVILIMTRWHDDDLAGRLLASEGEKGYVYDNEKATWVKVDGKEVLGGRTGQWEVVRFPAVATDDEHFRFKGEPLWVDKYDKEGLEQIKRTVGVRDWGALYQQDPVTEEGAEFDKKWFKYWKTLPKNLRYVTTVDLAISQRDTADDSVVMTCGMDAGDNIYIVEHKAWKANPSEVIDEIYRQNGLYGGVVAVETTGYQQALMHYIELESRKRGRRLQVEGVKYFSQKESRIRGLLPFYSNGLIHHNPGDCQVLEDQLTRFPSGRHDDVADALSMAIPYLKKPRSYAYGEKGGTIMKNVGISYTRDGRPVPSS